MNGVHYKIILIDDHYLFAAALKELFEVLLPDATVTVFTEAAKALRYIATSKERVDLVLLDIALKDSNGFEVLARIVEQHPTISVAMLTGSDNNRDVKRCFGAGGKGFIPKTLPPDATIQAIKLILCGENYLPSFYMSAPLACLCAKATVEQRLTARQSAVLNQLRQGYSNKQIATVLGITEGTVKIHVSAILKLLNLKSRSEVIAKM